MKKTTKRLLSVLLAFVMLAGILPAGGITARAEGTQVKQTVAPAVPVHTFKFHVDGEEWETVILKGEEELFEPTPDPSISGKTFVGWYKDAECTEPFDGFHKTHDMDDSTTDLYAGFEDICTIVYFDNKGRAIVSDEVEPGTEYTFNQAYPAFDPGEPNKRNAGWRDRDGNVYTIDTITVGKDLELRPVLAEGFDVYFDSQGGEAVVSQFVPNGETATEPKDPTYKGYNFEGWYTQAVGGELFDFNNEITKETTLYAHWSPGETEYCVIYVVQDGLTWDKYTFHSGYLKKGTTGETPPIVDTTGGTANIGDEYDKAYMAKEFKEGGYTAYFCNGNKTRNKFVEANPKIKADGSTVVTIYMDRVWYTLSYNGNTKSARWGENITNKLKQLTGKAPAQNSQYHFTYNGETVLSYKPYVDNVFPTPSRLAHNNGEEIPMFSELKLQKTDTFGGNYKYKIYYHEETLDSTPESRQYADRVDNRSFKNDNVIFDFYSTEKWKLFKLEYTAHEGEFTDSIETTLTGDDEAGVHRYGHAWYYRQKYDLRFVGKSDAVEYEKEDIMWGADISGYTPGDYVVDVTTKQKDGATYVFTGWYTDSACQNAFDFSKDTMPTHDLYLYSGWTPLKKTVTFDSNGGTYTGPAKEIVDYGKLVPKPPKDPEKTGLIFLGWTLNGKVWNFASPVTEDMMLVAQWFEADGYSLTYELGEGTGSVTDNRQFAPGFGAVVKRGNSDGDSIIPPPGKVFVYWKDDNGEIYKPGELVTILKNTTLTAVYAPPSPKVSLIYDLNYTRQGIKPPVDHEIDDTSVKDKPNNTVVDLTNRPTASETPAGYTFDGWYLDENFEQKAPDDNKVIIYSESLNEPDANTVYAKWAPKSDTEYTVEFYYKVKNAYQDMPDDKVTRAGTTGSTASVTDEDKRPTRAGYFLDNAAGNVLEGKIAGDGSLVLKVYFKQITVIIPDPPEDDPTPDLNSDDHFAYIIGYPDGNVHPEAQITRAEVATVFFRLLKDDVRNENLTKSNTFSDVDESRWFNTAVSTMAKLGIVNGYPDGGFHPNENITRAEFATIAARFDKYAAAEDADFSDIDGHWAKVYIAKAAARGWVNGYPDGTFKPDKKITRAEAMALVNRVLDRDPAVPEDLLENMIKWPDNTDTSKWYYIDVQEASNGHTYERKTKPTEKWVALEPPRNWATLQW